MSNNPKKVVIIGAGIIGSAAAYFLSQSNAEITLLDGDPEISGATAASFGWINANTPSNQDYFEFRMEALERWKRLTTDHRELPVRFSGSLDWDMQESDISPTFELYKKLGYASRIFSREEISHLAPWLKETPQQAIYNPQEGMAHPVETTVRLRDLAINNGVRFVHENVARIETRGGAVVAVRTASERIECDAVLACTGLGSRHLLSELQIETPLDSRAGLLIRTPPIEINANVLISTPDLHFWQQADGCILAGENQAGDLKTGGSTSVANAIRTKLEKILGVRISPLECETIEGKRPIPIDGVPIIGPTHELQNLYVAVMHSGITLAALVGQEIADTVITGKISDLLKPYSPTRIIKRFEPNFKEAV